MARPRSINIGVAYVASETLNRIRAKMILDKDFIPTESMAKVVHILARAQAVLHGRRAADEDEEDGAPIEQVKQAVTDLEKATEAEHNAKRAKA